MSDKRRWFQIHLSTAVVLMFVAGGLMWANVAEHHYNPPLITPNGAAVFSGPRGWPIVWDWNVISDMPRFNWGHLALNIVACLAILAAFACACEWRIRRRES